MKKLIYCLFLVLTFNLDAQEVRYSVITGPSLSWMSANFNKINGSGVKLAIKAHVQAEYWITERYALTGGIGFSLSQGGSLEYLEGGNFWKSAKLSDISYHSLPDNSVLGYSMNYLEFPFGFKLRTREFGKYRFYIQAPELAISLRTKARGSIEATGLEFTEDEDIRDVISFLSIFYGFGIGTEYTVSPDITLIGGLRFFQSLTDLTDDSGSYNSGVKEDSKGILSSLDFRVGVIF